MGFRLLLVLLLLPPSASSAHGSDVHASDNGSGSGTFDFSFFPHFQWRARVMGADGPQLQRGGGGPTADHPHPKRHGQETTFMLFDSHHKRPLGVPSTAVVANATGEWSPTAVFSNATVAAALAVYPNTLLINSPYGTGYDQQAGQPDYPAMVVNVQVQFHSVFSGATS